MTRNKTLNYLGKYDGTGILLIHLLSAVHKILFEVNNRQECRMNFEVYNDDSTDYGR